MNYTATHFPPDFLLRLKKIPVKRRTDTKITKTEIKPYSFYQYGDVGIFYVVDKNNCVFMFKDKSISNYDNWKSWKTEFYEVK